MARRFAYPIVALVGVALMLIGGCTERDNPMMEVERSSRTPFINPVLFDVLGNAPLSGDLEMTRIVSVAYASHEAPDIPQPPFPVLYLLHGFDGDGEYFGRYRLQTIVDDMFSKGEIGRMLVVTVGADTRLGGSYYRNSISSGRYADLIGSTIDYVERAYNVYRPTGRERDARAISGHGMGGYGAMRLAMENPEVFGSASSMSGPLSFEGEVDGQPWMDFIADRVFEENSLNRGMASDDSAAFFQALSADVEQPFLGKPYTRRLYAMAAAFSPRPLDSLFGIDTCVICNDLRGCDTTKPNQGKPTACYPCSVYADISFGRTTLTTFSRLPNRPDCSDPVTPPRLGIDFPFDWNADIVTSVWGSWQDSDVKTFLDRNEGILKDTIDLYFDCGVDDQYGYLGQNQHFLQALVDNQVNEDRYEYEFYSGSQGLPADHTQLIGDRLRKILKFHSDKFTESNGRPPGYDNPE